VQAACCQPRGLKRQPPTRECRRFRLRLQRLPPDRMVLNTKRSNHQFTRSPRLSMGTPLLPNPPLRPRILPNVLQSFVWRRAMSSNLLALSGHGLIVLCQPCRSSRMPFTVLYGVLSPVRSLRSHRAPPVACSAAQTQYHLPLALPRGLLWKTPSRPSPRNSI
jgi:hypothetical protein